MILALESFYWLMPRSDRLIQCVVGKDCAGKLDAETFRFPKMQTISGKYWMFNRESVRGEPEGEGRVIIYIFN